MQPIFTFLKKNFRLSLWVILLLFVSCDKTTQVGGTFVLEYTNQPIADLEIGLFQWKDHLDYLTTWNELELKASTTTDSNGRFLFNIPNEELIYSYLYLPILSNDSLSVNAKYTVKDSYYYSADWGTNQPFVVKPSVNVKINFEFGQPMDSVTIECDHIVGNHCIDGSPSMVNFSLYPGKSYDFIVSNYRNGVKIFSRIQSIYIRHNQENRANDPIGKITNYEFTIPLNE